jgi:hypothetical protein
MLSNKQLAAIIVETKLIASDELADAVAAADKEQRPLHEVLVERDLISDEHIGQLVAEQAGIDFINLRKVMISDDTLRIIPERMARASAVIAYDASTHLLRLAMADPNDLATIHLV